MTLCKESFKVCMMMATINRVYSKHSYFKHKNHAEYFVIRRMVQGNITTKQTVALHAKNRKKAIEEVYRMAKNCPAHAMEEYTGVSIIWEI